LSRAFERSFMGKSAVNFASYVARMFRRLDHMKHIDQGQAPLTAVNGAAWLNYRLGSHGSMKNFVGSVRTQAKKRGYEAQTDRGRVRECLWRLVILKAR